MGTASGANLTSKEAPLPRWFYVSSGALLPVGGVTYALRQNIPYGICLFDGIVMSLAHLRLIPVGWRIRVAFAILFATAGMVEFVTGHLIWGIVLLALAPFSVPFLRDIQRQPSGPS
jgi:hypothetical protein